MRLLWVLSSAKRVFVDDAFAAVSGCQVWSPRPWHVPSLPHQFGPKWKKTHEFWLKRVWVILLCVKSVVAGPFIHNRVCWMNEQLYSYKRIKIFINKTYSRYSCGRDNSRYIRNFSGVLPTQIQNEIMGISAASFKTKIILKFILESHNIWTTVYEPHLWGATRRMSDIYYF